MAAAPVDLGTRLAVERTWLAHERTMMAWVRTAASLISFGFSIYKFFQLDLDRARPAGTVGPRPFAMLMIAIGLVALLCAYLQHRSSSRTLGSLPGATRQRSIAGLVAGLVCVLGIAAILAVAFEQ